MRLKISSALRQRDDRGAVVLLVAAMTVVIFGVAALVVDLGQARVVRREAQSASDSSALAAANALYLAGVATPDIAGAVQAAKKYAADNYGVTEADWASCQDPHPLAHRPATTQCISLDDAVKPSTVRVVAPVRSVGLVLSSVFGADGCRASRRRPRPRSRSTPSRTARSAWSGSARTTCRTATPRSPVETSRSTATSP